MATDQFEQIEQVNPQLLAHYNELAQMAGSLAHEIKNPLSVIRMNVDLMAEDIAGLSSPDARRTINKIEVVQEQCTRLENLLNDFLRFSRLAELDLAAGDLNYQIDHVLLLFDPQTNENGIEVVRYLDPDLPTVMFNEETLQAALVNLVKNALEAMPNGGQLVVRTRLSRTGVALDLIDNGCGMDNRAAGKMFEPFYSTKDGGSGLGLPTTRKIIEAHGARISVQSEVGRGTQFTLEFPTPARLATTD